MARALVDERAWHQAFAPMFHPGINAILYRPATVWAVKLVYAFESWAPWSVHLIKGLFLGAFGALAFLFLAPAHGVRRSFAAAGLTVVTPVAFLVTWWPVEMDALGGAFLFAALVLLRASGCRATCLRATHRQARPATLAGFSLLLLALLTKENLAVTALVLLAVYLPALRPAGEPRPAYPLRLLLLAAAATLILYLPPLIAGVRISPSLHGLEILSATAKLLLYLPALLLAKAGLIAAPPALEASLSQALRLPFLLYHGSLQLPAASPWPLTATCVAASIALRLPRRFFAPAVAGFLVLLLMPVEWGKFSFFGATFLDPFLPSLAVAALWLFSLALEWRCPLVGDRLPATAVLAAVAGLTLVPPLLLFWRVDLSARLFLPLFPLFFATVLDLAAACRDRIASAPLRKLFVGVVAGTTLWTAAAEGYSYAAGYLALLRVERESRRALLSHVDRAGLVLFTDYRYRLSPDALALVAARRPTALLDPVLEPDRPARYLRALCDAWNAAGRPQGQIIVRHLYTSYEYPRKEAIPFQWLRGGYDYLETLATRPDGRFLYEQTPLPEMEQRLLAGEGKGLRTLLSAQGELVLATEQTFVRLPASLGSLAAKGISAEAVERRKSVATVHAITRPYHLCRHK